MVGVRIRVMVVVGIRDSIGFGLRLGGIIIKR